MSIDEPARAVPVGFEDRLAIATPEGVEIELTLAGLGSRFIAGMIDFAIRLLPLIALLVLVDPRTGAIGAAIFAIADFGLQFFYYVLFETLGGGRTPGKRATGLRVVRSGGRPVTFVRSMLRNIMRVIDAFAFYFVGMVTIFITNNNQRLGDLAADTLVVRDRHGDRRRGARTASGRHDLRPGRGAQLGHQRRVGRGRRHRALVPRATVIDRLRRPRRSRAPARRAPAAAGRRRATSRATSASWRCWSPRRRGAARVDQPSLRAVARQSPFSFVKFIVSVGPSSPCLTSAVASLPLIVTF